MATLLPYVLFLLILVFFSIVAYREYNLKITNYTIDRKEFTNTYLDILNKTDFNNFANLEYQDDALEVSKITEQVQESFLVVPPELLSYSFLLNPIRLAIMKILNETYKYPSAELRKILDASWGKFTPHITALEKKGYITTEDEFLDDTPRKVLILLDAGRQKFTALETILKGIMK